MRANIKPGLYLKLPAALLVLLGNVIGKMTGNALFPTPPVTLAQLAALHAALKVAIENATDGGVMARQHRKNVVLEVKEALRLVADYQRSVCGGDGAKLASGGFELSKQPEPSGDLGIPQRLVARATDQAKQVRLRWGRAAGGRAYDVQRADSDPTLGNATWTSIGITSRCSFEVNELEPYAPCWFRVSAIGKDKVGLPSDIEWAAPPKPTAYRDERADQLPAPAPIVMRWMPGLGRSGRKALLQSESPSRCRGLLRWWPSGVLVTAFPMAQQAVARIPLGQTRGPCVQSYYPLRCLPV